MSSSIIPDPRNKDDENPSLSTTHVLRFRFVNSIISDRPKPDPQIFLNDAWEKLKPATRTIFYHEENDFHRSEIFNAVRTAWFEKSSGETLYKLILEECGKYISSAILSLESRFDDDDDDDEVFLSLLNKCLLDYRLKLQSLCDFASGGGKTLGSKSLLCLGDELFPKHLYTAPEVSNKLRSIALHLIRDHRSGKSVDISQLQNLMSMFDASDFHESDSFKKPFLDCAVEFFSAEAIPFNDQSSDISNYLMHVEQILRKEKELCRRFNFFYQLEYLVTEAVVRTLLSDHASAILEKGVVMFDLDHRERRHDDLRRMYRLFSETRDILRQLNDAFSFYILRTGQKMLKEEGSSLMELKKSIEKICNYSFSQDALLKNTAKQRLENLGLPPDESESESIQIFHPFHI